MNDDFLRRVARYQEKSLSEDELSQLNEELRNDPAKRDVFIDHCQLAQLIRDTESESKVRPVEFGKTPDSRWTIGWAMAASVALLLGITLWRSPSPDLSPYWVAENAAVATVSQSVGAWWLNGEPIRTGRRLRPQTIEIASGLIRLDFTNGARVGIEGPARIEIGDAMNLVLHHGIVTADIPETAHGFSIHTEAAEVVDLGTAFGVSVLEGGLTEVCVFEGEVEIKGDANEPTKRISEGKAMRAEAGKSELQSVAYDTDVFEKAWPITSGVLQTTGVMKFVSPGPDFIPGKHEDDEHILVFAEQRDVRLESALAVDLTAPGEYRRLKRDENLLLEPGLRVRSYLLQLNPVGRIAKHDPDKTVVTGQITFGSPILGLIGANEKLMATDELLGNPDGHYGTNRRGLEAPRRADGEKAGRDMVVLAAGRRTLILNLKAGSALDQIRVLVMAE